MLDTYYGLPYTEGVEEEKAPAKTEKKGKKAN